VSLTIGQHAAELRLWADALPRLVEAELRSTGLAIVNESKQLARTRLKVRSGMLMRSIRQEVVLNGAVGVLTVRAGGGDRDVQYARLQELGGTVTPKKGRFLAIPTPLMLTGSGVARVASPRQVPGLIFIPIHGGNAGLLVRKNLGKRAAKKQPLQVMFWLVPRTTVKAKNYLGDAFDGGIVGVGERMQERVGVLLLESRGLS